MVARPFPTVQAPHSTFARSQSTKSTMSGSDSVTVSSLGLKGDAFSFEKQQPMKSISKLDTSKLRDPFPITPKTPLVEPVFDPISIKNTWENPQIRPVPKYYPMERSSRILDLNEHSLEEITANLSASFRVLGMQVKYFEAPAGAALLTPEQVEAYLYLWKTDGGKQVCVEVQRRRGDSVTFHRYARYVLEAASGDFEVSEYKDYTDSRYLKAAEKLLRTEMAKAAQEREESLMSIELAAGLIKKDRFDARLLGMESLCILTDPRKTNLNTALLASHAVLFGAYKGEEEHEATFTSMHHFVLNVVQNKCMGDEESLLQDMVVEYDSDDEDFFDEENEERDDKKPPEYHDSMKTLTNYGLTILTNAWEVLTTFESFESEPESTDSAFSVNDAVAQFYRIAYDFTHTDILTTLQMELHRAETKVHNACLAAKCLRILCQSCEDFRERTKVQDGIAQASRAEEIGKQTNARLERESSQLLLVLQE